MIVIDKETTDVKTSEATLQDMFYKEIDAYCMYKKWVETTDDDILEMALEEIMLDEFLHARFLRDYMMEHDMYVVQPTCEYEKKYWEIHRKIFHK